MRYFEHYTTKSQNHFCTKALVIYYTNSEDELDNVHGTPSCWESVWNILALNHDYIRYDIFHKKLPCDQCTRITDHKGIWGLLVGVEKGEAETAYIKNDSKVYIGVRKTEDLSLSGLNSSNVLLLLPSKSTYSSQDILRAFSENNADFDSDRFEMALAKIAKRFEKSFLIYFTIRNSIAGLHIYGDVGKYDFEALLRDTFDENSRAVVRRQ